MASNKIFQVDIQSVSGRSGDSIRVRAADEEEASELALADKTGWAVVSVNEVNGNG